MGYVINSFQNPNFYADELDEFLEPTETKVLLKAIREIIGWHHLEDRAAFISYKTFLEGKFDRKTGKQLARGCGLCKSTLKKALEGLQTYRILHVVKTPSLQNGALYVLNFDTDTIDWEGLQQRRADKLARNARNIRAAREQNPLVK